MTKVFMIAAAILGVVVVYAVKHPDEVVQYVPAPVLDQAGRFLPAQWLPRRKYDYEEGLPRRRGYGRDGQVRDERSWDAFRSPNWGQPDYGQPDGGHGGYGMPKDGYGDGVSPRGRGWRPPPTDDRGFPYGPGWDGRRVPPWGQRETRIEEGGDR